MPCPGRAQRVEGRPVGALPAGDGDAGGTLFGLSRPTPASRDRALLFPPPALAASGLLQLVHRCEEQFLLRRCLAPVEFFLLGRWSAVRTQGRRSVQQDSGLDESRGRGVDQEEVRRLLQPEVFNQVQPQDLAQPVNGREECWGNSRTRLTPVVIPYEESRAERCGMIDLVRRQEDATGPENVQGGV